MKAGLKIFVVAVFMATVGAATVFAAGGIKSATFNSNKIILDGKELNLGGQRMLSVVKDGEQDASNYMPIRSVLQAMGYTIDWDSQNQAVIITSSYGAINSNPAQATPAAGIKSSTFNSNKVILDGKELDLGGQKMISIVKEGEINASNYIPVRGILQEMGYTVDWDAQKQAVIVTSPIIRFRPDISETIAPTPELLSGYWVTVDFGYGGGDDFANAMLENTVVKYYFGADGKVACYAELWGIVVYESGTYSITETDILSMIIDYVDAAGEKETLTGDKAHISGYVVRLSADGEKLYIYQDDTKTTLIRDAGEEFKAYQ